MTALRPALPAHIAQRLAEVHGRIAAAASAAGRSPADITLVAVSKEVDAERVVAALAAGQRDFGENRARELVAKADRLEVEEWQHRGERLDREGLTPAWHFIGRLQRNKVKAIAPHVSLWHSVDRLELGEEIARAAPNARVLVQVNVAAEVAKAGCTPAALPELADALHALGLVVGGLMTVPPQVGDPRPHFATLRELAAGLGLPTLSMGMSGDFEVAIAEGATIVRIGSAVFGLRPPQAEPFGSDL